MKLPDLKLILSEYGYSLSGIKKELVIRIKNKSKKGNYCWINDGWKCESMVLKTIAKKKIRSYKELLMKHLFSNYLI